MTKRDKITVDDIIGIVHTDETTNSVEEVKKLRGRNERFMVDTAGTLIDMVTRNNYDYVSEVLPLLNEQNNAINELINSEKYWEKKATQRINKLTKENEQLKTQLSQLAKVNREGVEKVQKLSYENEQLKSENETYKNMFFEIVETALTDKNCRELYCKGILDIFDKANSLNQAREMIKEHLK